MARSKAQQNSLLLDPNRQKIAKSNAALPGGPENNNPMNVTSVASGRVTSDSIYGDYRQDYDQMGTQVIDPMGIKPSGLQESFPMTTVGFNRQPYGTQKQPPTSGHDPAAETMEAARLHRYGVDKELPSNGMGLIGGPPIPGALPSNMAGTTGPGFGETYAGLVPGSTPQKIGKKKKGGKA